jgi:hypothetical protein
MLTFLGGADSANLTAPHWQPPVKTGLVAEVMFTPAIGRLPAARSAHRRPQKRNR